MIFFTFNLNIILNYPIRALRAHLLLQIFLIFAQFTEFFLRQKIEDLQFFLLDFQNVFRKSKF